MIKAETINSARVQFLFFFFSFIFISLALLLRLFNCNILYNFVFNKIYIYIYLYLYVYSVRTVKSSLVIDDLNSICNCAAFVVLFLGVLFVFVLFLAKLLYYYVSLSLL